jgi:hypothetical protein
MSSTIPAITNVLTSHSAVKPATHRSTNAYDQQGVTGRFEL